LHLGFFPHTEALWGGGFGFSVFDFGFQVSGFGLRVWGSQVSDLGLRVWGSQVSGLGLRVWGSQVLVKGGGGRVSGCGVWVSGG